MPNDDQAKAAIEALNGSQVDDRTLKVSESRPQERRPGGGGGRGGGGGFRGGGAGGGGGGGNRRW
jgi:RNA recognition motif-containing protein